MKFASKFYLPVWRLGRRLILGILQSPRLQLPRDEDLESRRKKPRIHDID